MNFFYKRRRPAAGILLLLLVLQWMQPTVALALTSGPTQPEVQSFQPAGVSEMVDLFTGDFSYNIPLFELPGPNGGYPFNLSYQSGITMEQEASWAGLGWNLNPGAINRQMRGLPDEFSGDSILTKTTVAPSVTVGLGAGVSGELFGKDKGLSSLGFSIAQNNYKGMSYNIDASLGFSRTTSSGKTAQLGLNVSLDSKEGVGVSPSLGLGNKIGEVGLGAGYNSKTGLHSFSLSAATAAKPDKKPDRKSRPTNLSASSTISLSHPGYTPQITMPMKNTSFSATVKLGAGAQGVYAAAYGRGFYNEQVLKDDKKIIKSHAYGYLNYQKSSGDGDLLDLNREKDGIVSQNIPNLGIPSLTYDIYSVTGQGIGAMYRPFRNDLGVVHDQEVSSVSIDAGGGVDVGIPLHVGGNLSLNHSKSTSGKWSDNNSFASLQSFQDNSLNSSYEPWYFKVHGEQSADDKNTYASLGGDNAVRVQLSGSGNDITAGQVIENRNWNGQSPSSSSINQERKSRNQVIQTITNGQLVSGSSELLSLFKIQYLNSDSTLQSFNRAGLPKHHIAGLTALTADGLRYTYAIPAYNTYQEEVSFTAQKALNTEVNKVDGKNEGQEEPVYDYDGTDKFLRTTKMPPYAHSYLLTSIVGPDYVDVTNNGVTSDDLGYWVKFTYHQRNSSSNAYQWRDPYSQAHYLEGWKTDPRDDKGSFTYGKKELWYMAMAETKSHIAIFKTSKRNDGYGVAQKLQDHNGQGTPVYKLNEIDLFTRSAQNNYKIKVVRFEYDYSLCHGVYNSKTGEGKLTLKKVWFEYGSSTRGKLNPYVFDYNSFNPDYSAYAYDRWGTYKPSDETDPLQNIDAPYSLQAPDQKKLIDQYASAWSLTDIQLPSGGKIKVDYETDDYSYVQQQPAMQMLELVDPYTNSTSTLNANYLLKDSDLKVRFKLEKPIPGNTTPDQSKEVLQYIDQVRKQLFFKMKVNLRSLGEGFYEYISGYADIDFSKTMALEKDASGNYTYGYFYVVAENKSHPFSVRAWQHLRTNQPELANSGAKLSQATTNTQRINQIKSLGSIITQVRQMFEGFQKFCSDKHWGREVIASKSWIRLNSPDQIKYGGGLRVRQVSIQDQWEQDQEGVYGQVYEYITSESGSTKYISSGVAAYEPIVGGEENAVHYAKKFSQSVALRSDNNLYFEYPINESYYPGPQVGYGKVTVTSLGGAHLAGKSVKNVSLADTTKTIFPKGANVSYGTSGTTVHEFYTAKDFPVITDETDKQDKPYKLNVSIPFLGSITTSNLSTSQGYLIITNDMHGKQKKVSNYRQDRTGKIDPKPISWVKYNYRRDSVVNNLGLMSKISNVFQDNGDGTLSIPTSQQMNDGSSKFLLGQETEFFTDMRQFDDKTWGGGTNINTDGIFVLFGVIPIPSWWPNVSKSQMRLRTSVTNKIVFKSGILESTEAYDEGSHITTRNIKWDKQTGTPVLTTVVNNFNAPVYSYNIPAYTQYIGMGGAYQNIGTHFTIDNLIAGTNGRYQFTSSLSGNLLQPGDELLLYADDKLISPLANAVFMGDATGVPVLYSSSTLTASSYKAIITRSGYRNQLSVMAGSLTALKDPSVPGSMVTHSKTVVVPATKE
jgi:hypothetical protein